MKISIVSTHFHEQRHIGSNRAREMAFWLDNFGHDVTVFTRIDGDIGRPEESRNDYNEVSIRRGRFLERVHTILRGRYTERKSRPKNIDGDTSGLSKVSTRSKLRIWRKWRRLPVLIFHIIDDCLWSRRAIRQIETSGAGSYDIVFSTYGPFASHWLGHKIRAQKIADHWVADFRDEMAASSLPTTVRYILRLHERRSTRLASSVVAVSDGLASTVAKNLGDARSLKVHTITNGFRAHAPAPANTATAVDGQMRNRQDDVLRICYTGTLYGLRSDARELFHAIRTLALSNEVDLNRIEVHYAGRESSNFLSQAATEGMEAIVVDHGFVTKERAQELQGMADILLVLSWNEPESIGILTGKIFEYMSTQKPILGIISGDVPGSELANLIRSLGLGFVLETVNAELQRKELSQFIMEAYNTRASGAKMPPAYSRNLIQKFEYKNLARRLEAVFLTHLDARPSNDL